MNGRQQTAVSRKELRQITNNNNQMIDLPGVGGQVRHAGCGQVRHAGDDNYQILFSPGCKQPLRDNVLSLWPGI